MERTPVEQIKYYRDTCLTPITEAQLTPEIQRELELNFRFTTAFYLCPENSQRTKNLILKGVSVTLVVYWGEDLLNLIKSGEPVFWNERTAMRHYLLAHWRGVISTGLLGYFDVLDEFWAVIDNKIEKFCFGANPSPTIVNFKCFLTEREAIFEAEHSAIVNGAEITKENFKCLSKRERENVCDFWLNNGAPTFGGFSRITEEDVYSYQNRRFYLGMRNTVNAFCKYWSENN